MAVKTQLNAAHAQLNISTLSQKARVSQEPLDII